MSDVVADAPSAASTSMANVGAPSQAHVPAAPAPDEAAAQRAFSTAMLVSATRCLLTYIVLPFVAPGLGFAAGVGPGIGIAIGVVAIGANIFTVRRFHKTKHRLRWGYSAIAVCVLGLLVVLLGQDISRLL